MNEVKGLPPNYDILKLVLNPSPDVVFCYGSTIYNPSGKKLSPDIEHHEYIHSKQQGENPELWWNRYLQDKDFRLDQELKAYQEQYAFAKKNIPNKKLLTWAKEQMSLALSGKDYGNLISYGEAESKIRNYGKTP